MPVLPSPLWRLPSAFAAALLAVALGLLSGTAAQPEPLKKSADSPAKADELPIAKLPDGTFLWLGTPISGAGEQVRLTPQELDKLLEQLDQLKKQLAAKKTPNAPSGCAVR